MPTRQIERLDKILSEVVNGVKDEKRLEGYTGKFSIDFPKTWIKILRVTELIDKLEAPKPK